MASSNRRDRKDDSERPEDRRKPLSASREAGQIEEPARKERDSRRASIIRGEKRESSLGRHSRSHRNRHEGHGHSYRERSPLRDRPTFESSHPRRRYSRDRSVDSVGRRRHRPEADERGRYSRHDSHYDRRPYHPEPSMDYYDRRGNDRYTKLSRYSPAHRLMPSERSRSWERRYPRDERRGSRPLQDGERYQRSPSRDSCSSSSSSVSEKEEDLTEDQLMAKLIGVTNFDTTKGKDHTKSDASGLNKKTKRRYRQYMNRRGGFNRPLSPIF